VFSEVHLISCRNVLIYFDRELQDRALGLFSNSLVHGGFLGLGAQETVRFSSEAPAFSDFSASERIYRRAPTRPIVVGMSDAV
jgi:chemotaxis protein methyltransferase CheR